jgi:PPM family protein phosphatase
VPDRPAIGSIERGALKAPKLYVGGVDAEMDLFTTAAGHVAVATIADEHKPRPNEDSAAIVPIDGAYLVLIVADGVGGLPAARRASNLTVETVHRALEKHNGDGAQLRTTILDGIEAANQAVRDLGTGAASTLALAEVGPGYVRTYHVGDSIILLCGQRGRVKLQTVPHSPVGFAMESGLLDESQALQHVELNLIFNVIGSADMRIEIGSKRPLSPRDTLLLASDGLADNLMPDEIVDAIRKGDLEAGIQALAALAQSRMKGKWAGLPSKPDDFTAVLYRPAGVRKA